MIAAKSIAEKSIGISFFVLTGYAFSYVLYPLVIYKAGALRGGGIMTFLSFVVCLLLLKLYDTSKRDWLGIEAIKRLKDYDGHSMFRRLWAWFLGKNEFVIFLFLSIKIDAFVTTIYLRRGNYGMSKRDWTFFAGSVLLSNIYWTLACFMGITVFEWAWKTVTKIIN